GFRPLGREAPRKQSPRRSQREGRVSEGRTWPQYLAWFGAAQPKRSDACSRGKEAGKRGRELAGGLKPTARQVASDIQPEGPRTPSFSQECASPKNKEVIAIFGAPGVMKVRK